MMRRCSALVRVLLAFAIVGLLVAMPTGAHAGPGDVVEVGWWTRVPTASAPDGGFNLGSAPDGPNSVAAIRLDSGSLGVSALTLQAVESGGSGALATVSVCAADEVWAPTGGGDLADAPAIDCSIAVPFNRDDAGTWTADIATLAAGKTGTFSVGLVAAEASGDGGPLGVVVPIEVAFFPPTIPSNTPITTTTAAPAPTTTRASSFTPTTRAPVAQPSRPAVTNPPRTTAPATTAPAPTTTATTTTLPQIEERALPPAALQASQDDDREGRPYGEAVVLALLSGVVGTAVGLVSKFTGG